MDVVVEWEKDVLARGYANGHFHAEQMLLPLSGLELLALVRYNCTAARP